MTQYATDFRAKSLENTLRALEEPLADIEPNKIPAAYARLMMLFADWMAGTMWERKPLEETALAIIEELKQES